MSVKPLDDPALAPPTHHAWLDHDLPWTRFGDGRPTYPASRYCER